MVSVQNVIERSYFRGLQKVPSQRIDEEIVDLASDALATSG